MSGDGHRAPPRTWREVPLRFVLADVDDRGGGSSDDLLSVSQRHGVVPRRDLVQGEARADTLTHYKRCHRDDIVLNRMSAYHGALGVAPQDGTVSPDYSVLRVDSRYSPHFVAYVLRSHWGRDQMAARVRGIGGVEAGGNVRTPRLNFSDLGLIAPSFPDIAHQQLIAGFLDRECERIETTLAALHELWAHARHARDVRLEERLLALRSEWPLRKLAWDTSLLGGFAFKSEAFVHDPGAGVRLVRGTNVTPVGIRWDDVVYWPHERIDEATRFELRSGDLIVGLNRPWVSGGLRTAIIEDGDLPALLLQRVGCIRPRAGVQLSTRYLQLWMQTAHFRTEVGDDAAVTFPMLEPDRLLAYRVPNPPVDVQAALVGAAAKMSTGLLALGSEIDNEKSALVEYRDALITEAVTGQLDIVKLTGFEMAERVSAVRERAPSEVLAQ